MTPLLKTLSMEKCTHPTKCRFLYSRTCLLYNCNIDFVRKDICTHRHIRGFINRVEWIKLRDLVNQISENKGLLNKLHHLYQPDTDSDGITLRENLQDSKISIVNDLIRIKQAVDFIIKRILELT